MRYAERSVISAAAASWETVAAGSRATARRICAWFVMNVHDRNARKSLDCPFGTAVTSGAVASAVIKSRTRPCSVKLTNGSVMRLLRFGVGGQRVRRFSVR